MATRQPLSRARIIEAAARVADRGGLSAVSMRGVGKELSVEAMSLYHHVADKESLLDGLADWAFARIELPSAGQGWREGMETRARSARARSCSPVDCSPVGRCARRSKPRCPSPVMPSIRWSAPSSPPRTRWGSRWLPTTCAARWRDPRLGEAAWAHAAWLESRFVSPSGSHLVGALR